MKLLSWMRTIKQNGLVQSKEFKGDFCCLRAQVAFSEVQDIRTNSFSFYGSSHNDQKQRETHDEELLFDHEDGFGGFLAIGTLGIDPETPRFTVSVAQEDVTETQKEMAELITRKLDKFHEEHPEDSSSKQVERLNAEEVKESDVCPSYDLVPSSIELTRRCKEVKKKKGLFTSLFKRRKTVQGGVCNAMEKHGTRVLIKSIFEKLHVSSSETRYEDVDDYMHKKKGLRKNVQIFPSKVHPLLYSPGRDDKEIDDRCINLKIPRLNGGLLVSNSCSEANSKRENWIKTDAEYLVLEL